MYSNFCDPVYATATQMTLLSLTVLAYIFIDYTRLDQILENC